MSGRFAEFADGACDLALSDVPDRRPVEEVLWAGGAYREIHALAGLDVLDVHKPLAKESEPYPWVNETRVAPWVIHGLGKSQPPGA